MELDNALDDTEYLEVRLWGSDRVQAEAWFDFGFGWRYRISHYSDETGWDVIAKGVCKSPTDALANLADAVLDLAHGWEF